MNQLDFVNSRISTKVDSLQAVRLFNGVKHGSDHFVSQSCVCKVQMNQLKVPSDELAEIV